MNTELIEIFEPDDSKKLEKCAKILRNDGTLVIPTETVYGLGANAYSSAAVEKIFIAKGRPQDNPLIVHISNISMLDDLVREVPEKAKLLIEEFWPGPLTIIFNRSDNVPSEVSAGLNTVAIRFPKNEVARAIIDSAGLPIAAPSANISGKPSPTSASHCIDDLMGKVDGIVVSHDSTVGLESTVITLVGDTPTLLRPGGITLEQLKRVLGRVDIDPAVLQKPQKNKPVASPGMKYKHYSPKADVTLIESDDEKFISFVNSKPEGTYALCTKEQAEKIIIPTIILGEQNNDEAIAASLFGALRELDNRGAEAAYIRVPDKKGVGLAMYNRLIRAAGFKIIEL